MATAIVESSSKPPENRDAPAQTDMGDVQKLIVSCNRDGMQSMRQGDLKAAFEQFKYAEAILLANQLEGDSTSLLATTCNNLGCYYKKVGKYHGALSYLRRALKLEVEMGVDEVSLAGTHLNLCAVLSKLEKHEKAVQHALIALDKMNHRISVALKGDHRGVAPDDYTVLSIAYHNVGLERENLEQWDEAASSFRTGYEVAKRFLGESHALTITLFNNSNAVLLKARQTKKRPGESGLRKSEGFGSASADSDTPSRQPSTTGKDGDVLKLPPITPKVKKDTPGRKKANLEANEYLKNEEALWANFAFKTLKSEGPAIDEDVGGMTSENEESQTQPHEMVLHGEKHNPLARTALAEMQDMGLILPQAHDMGLFRFQDKSAHAINKGQSLVDQALDEQPKMLMDIMDVEGEGEPSKSAPNDFRPNRSMKRSTRTTRVLKRTGVFNSTANRDKVMADMAKLAAFGPPVRAASEEKQNEAAAKIQTVWRAWHKYLQDNSNWMTVTWICATMIQSHWRSYHVRRQKLDAIVTKIQKIWRGVLVRRTLRWHNAAVTIQKRMVGILTRMKLQRLHKAATNMQRLVRGGLARRRYAKLFEWKVGVIVTIQRYVRIWLAKRRSAEKRQEKEEERLLFKATVDLQRMFRGWKGRMKAYIRYREELEAKEMYNAATKLQTVYRCRQARKKVDAIRLQRLQEIEKAATFLRKVWLGAQTKKKYKQLQNDFARATGTIITIQRYMRGCLCRSRLWKEAVKSEEEQWAAIEIQRHWRGYCGRVKWENKLESVWRREMAAAVLQRNLRGWIARVKTNRKKRKIARAEFERARARFFGAQKIQARMRGILARKVVHNRLIRSRAAATAIQRIHRGGMVRVSIWTQVREQKAHVIQAAMRGYLVRKRAKHLLRKVLLIQHLFRSHLELPRLRRQMHVKKMIHRRQQAELIQQFVRKRAKEKQRRKASLA